MTARLARGRVAILGAGIMGCATALFLARRGIASTLFDQTAAPMSGASRWNEGKIHLGYLYAGDPSLETARRVLPGGLAFKSLVEELVGALPDDTVTPEGDIYLIHRKSVVSPEAAERYFAAVTDLFRDAGAADRYLGGGRRTVARLSPAELASLANDRLIVAGFRVPERSVSTVSLADRFVAAIADEPLVETTIGRRVTGVTPADETRGRWRVVTDGGSDGPFAFVVNALWEGRLAVDASHGLAPEPGWSHRYRRSLFVTTSQALDLPSAVIATGPFGDIKDYNGRDFYLSWYPAGLAAEGTAIEPPAVPALDSAGAEGVAAAIVAHLAAHIPCVADVWARAARWRLEGGWVFARGAGLLSDPAATLHRRDRIGIRRLGTYLSVDTGKYSVAPWLAAQIADLIAGA